MDEYAYWRLKGYLEALASIQSCADRNVGYEFTFDKIESCKDLETGLRVHLKQLLENSHNSWAPAKWNRWASKEEALFDYNEQIDGALFDLTVFEDWENNLRGSFNFWMRDVIEGINNDIGKKNVYNCFLDFILYELYISISSIWTSTALTALVEDIIVCNCTSNTFVIQIEEDYYRLTFCAWH